MGAQLKYNSGRDFRVRTRIYSQGQATENESAVALNPGVQTYLAGRPEIIWFQIYDGPYFGSRFQGYYAPGVRARKIYYVPYSKSKNSVMVGPGLVLVFDQKTGDLIYDGSDGGV
ncbi:MAG: hypothetical protein PSW75_04920 [bacterium]|nr:hypothetical protein [bacterium]MDI1337871.1 hypothetical protein [Lacunisphaera sp.]